MGHGAVLPVDRSAGRRALARGEDVAVGGGCGACEAESGEGCRGDDGGEEASNAYVVPLSRIASFGALLTLAFTRVGGMPQ
ncbi:hypothetical protein STXM2123_3751 [Streptomyces sp. F-3]|nr:hypothetical protein STXM2123_3751 [Streptomyces sp. F-3]